MLAPGCGSRDGLDDAYERVYLSMFAIDFPPSRAAFSDCERNRVARCLELVERAKEGKRALLSRSTALDDTLNTIASTCDGDERMEVCLGAVVSLYFFGSPDEDARILRMFVAADRLVQQKMLGPAPFSWHANRPTPDRWLDALQALPESAFPRTGKDVVIEGFRSPRGRYSDGGVALL